MSCLVFIGVDMLNYSETKVAHSLTTQVD